MTTPGTPPPTSPMQGHTHSTQHLPLSHTPVFSPLTEKINIRVLDPFTIKPLDRNLILESARATKGRILTVEDHYYEGNRPAGEPGTDGSGNGWAHRATGRGPQRAECPSFTCPRMAAGPRKPRAIPWSSWVSVSCWAQAWPGTQQTWLPE